MVPAPPPDDPGATGPRSQAFVAEDSEQTKAKLDDAELSTTGSPRALQKVELDLDDAPFLEEEEELPPPPEELPKAPAPQPLGDVPVKLPLWKNKKVILGAAALLLILIGFCGWWFFLRADEPPPPPPPPPPVVEPPKPVEPPPPPPPADIFVPMAPFLVEKSDEKGATKILSLKVKLVYKEDPRLAQEIQAKTFSLRDGLYYNLKNKSFALLTDKDSVEQLRDELRGVVNNYLNTGQIDQILFEELLVK
ncbi:hypothetical protein NNJEOMEG_00373 [Fundidesulfovibrio magnetotacticus]|uniref:Flagellar protein FliL n=1 Tax=Fundidesulfovibrio magnetotacticus TaxID=2730080 RepID=A0A6V8LQD5_9BACT|nr:flagellar basal body-associated FliL family protein [Fundidesulfovibrio magnetotacticus]GFK92548.1 hypothetical protein NNJEOMEG_00373 [Fundidesulfovibrio magnetotacticus]